MEEINEISGQIDAVYKNLQENFHPQTRELLTAAKAYLKALHGSTAAFSLYLDAMNKFAQSMSQLNEERSKDFETNVATRLNNLHSQQLAFLKSFYIDFILPIENNLERDVKVVQAHHRSYISQKQVTLEAFKKASSTVKKLKKKKSVYSNKGNLDKEIRGLQAYQEERDRVEEFFGKSLKEVVGMEMRRFEFVFEKQELLFNLSQAQNLTGSEPGLALSRSSSEATLMSLKISRDGHYVKQSKDKELEHEKEQERKKVDLRDRDLGRDHKGVQRSTSHPSHFLLQHQDTKEDVFEEDEDDIGAPPAQPPPPPPPPPAPPMAISMSMSEKKPEVRGEVKKPSQPVQQKQKALYSYKRDEEGEDDDGFHQLLSFEEGDLIELIGNPSSFGWQYGTNARTKRSGWFPISYLQTQTQLSTGRKEAIYSTLEKVEVPEVDYEDSEDEEEVFYMEKQNRRNLSAAESKRFFSTSCRELHSSTNMQISRSNPSFMKPPLSPRDLDLIISLDSPLKLSPTLSRSASFASTASTSVQEKKPRLFTKLIKRTFSFVTMGKSDAAYLEGRNLPWDDVGDEFKFDSLNVRRTATVGYGEVGKGQNNNPYSSRRRGRWDDLWGDDVYATRR